MTMRLMTTVSGIVAVAAVAAVGLAQDAKVERGKAVYAEQKCKMCHSIAGDGNAKGPLDEVGSKVSAADMKQWLVAPKEMTEKTKSTRKPPMKSFATLSAEDQDALVAYMLTLKGK
jgi:mono/diheme cytochrome c family protein